jgi:hypothetical protein
MGESLVTVRPLVVQFHVALPQYQNYRQAIGDFLNENYGLHSADISGGWQVVVFLYVPCLSIVDYGTILPYFADNVNNFFI